MAERGAAGEFRRRAPLGPRMVDRRPHHVSQRRRPLRLAHQHAILRLRRRSRRAERAIDVRRLLLRRQVGPLVQFARIARIGRAGGPRRLKQPSASTSSPDKCIHGLQVLQPGEIAGQEAGGEVPQLQVRRRELHVSRLVAARRQQQILLAEHHADLVELGRADRVNPPANRRRRQFAGRRFRFQGEMDAGVKQQPPAADQQIVGRAGRRALCGLGRASRMTFSGSTASSVQAEFRLLDDFQQRLAADHVALAVRHRQAEAGQPPVLLDDPAENAGEDEKRRRIGRPDGPLQFGERATARRRAPARSALRSADCHHGLRLSHIRRGMPRLPSRRKTPGVTPNNSAIQCEGDAAHHWTNSRNPLQNVRNESDRLRSGSRCRPMFLATSIFGMPAA